MQRRHGALLLIFFLAACINASARQADHTEINGQLHFGNTTLNEEDDPIVPSDNTQTLVHYWNFNDNTTLLGLLTPTVSLVPGASIVVEDGGNSYIHVAGGTGQDFDVDNHNARLGDPAGSHLRFNNPIGGELYFHLPTTGFSNPIVRFAMRRSGQGAGLQHWYYATDSLQQFTLFQTLVAIDGNPMPITLDFSSIPEASDNPWFTLRATFSQGAGGTVGNNRFDNFSLDGDPMMQTPLVGATVDTIPHFSHVTGTPSDPAYFHISAINLLEDVMVLAPASFEVSASPYSGFVQGLILSNNAGEIPSERVYVRLNAPVPGSFDGNLLITSTGADTLRVALSGTCTPPPQPLSVVTYWHFNTLNTSAGDVTVIEADHHAVHGTTARMTYTGGQPGDRDIDAYSEGSYLNLQLGYPAGQAARVRNPSDGRALVFDLPTVNYKDLRFSYAVHRSPNGMLSHEMEYTTDGINYTTYNMPQSTFHISDTYDVLTADFFGITAAENNPNFGIRITFTGNTGGSSGNNRFDNITLEGNMISSTGDITGGMTPLTLYPNPVTQGSLLRFNTPIDFTLFDIHGRVALTGRNATEVTTGNLSKGVYLLRTAEGSTHRIIVQ